MELQILSKLKDKVKVGFVVTITEKVFSQIKVGDERYLYAREALNNCWIWVESNGISGDDLYELIDNAECKGISEFAEDEEDLNIAKLWSLLVDTVSYTSWNVYKKENTKYLPQALKSINEESFIILIESAVETGFISKDEIAAMEQHLLFHYQNSNDSIVLIREDFMKKIISDH